MIRFSWDGGRYLGDLVEELKGGDCLVRAKQQGPRFGIGSIIRLKANQIVDRNVPGPASDNSEAVARALAAERSRIPSVESIVGPVNEAAKPQREEDAEKATVKPGGQG